MQTEFKTVEELQQEIERLKLAEADYKKRGDDYENMIQTFRRFKDNIQDEYYNIRQEIRDNERAIASIQCPFKVDDKYNINKLVYNDIEFFQIKIENIRFDLFTNNISKRAHCNTIISIKGKSSKTNKWRMLPTTTTQELESIIINKI